jgi:hypothetical protein
VETLPQLLKRLERYIYNLPSVRQRNTLPRTQLKLVTDMANTIEQTRKQVEFSVGDEDDEARLKGFLLAREQLSHVRASMLRASEYNLLNPVDIAHLSAMSELAEEQLSEIIKRQ